VRRRRFIAFATGMPFAWPLSVIAQQPTSPAVGYLGAGTHELALPFLPVIHTGLKEGAHVGGLDGAVFRWAEGRHDQLSTLAAELVALRVTVIIAPSSPAAVAARLATSTTPIAFFAGGDRIEHGLVSSLARPDGNATGIFNYPADLMPKRLELLRELLPNIQSIAFLTNPDHPTAAQQLRDVHAAAQHLKFDVWTLEARTTDDIRNAFTSLTNRRPHALVVAADVFFVNQRGLLVAGAARHALPAIYDWSEFVTAGGLVSYGANLRASLRLLGTYAGKILAGARPGDLPVQQPTTFELAINLKTARVLGLTVPPSLLARADEVIE
jgi:putative tryptophan/tyrosine transport system substrate-binding protein